jgi:hypothetical protein
MVLQPRLVRARSGSQSLEASSRALADNADDKNSRVANPNLRITKDH